MKNLFLVVLFSFVLLSSTTYPQWSEQASGITSHLYSVSAVDENNAWAVGTSNKILRTTDGGKTWVQQTCPNATYRNVLFFDLNNGFCTGGYTVYKTTNGGTNWTEYKLPLGSTINDSYFLDFNTGWVICNSGHAYRTTDAGVTWVQQTLPGGSAVYSIHMLNKDTGFIVGINGKLLKTTNGGTDWLQMPNVGSTSHKHIWFADVNNGLIATAGGVYKTTDGGNNWTFISLTSYWNYDFITSSSSTKIWVICTGGAMTSVDNGTTWIKEDTPTFGYAFWQWYGLSFGNQNVGWLVGSSGKIVKTTNAATLVEEGKIQNYTFSLTQNYPNPFNPSTVISWQLAVSSDVTLKVYDVLGNEVATLVNEEKQPGSYEVVFQLAVGSRQLASGVYYYQLRAGDFVETKKFILMK